MVGLGKSSQTPKPKITRFTETITHITHQRTKKLEKPLPKTPTSPLPLVSTISDESPAAAAAAATAASRPSTELPQITYPQPHYHRVWYRICHHRAPTVRIPWGGAKDRKNNDKLCMCDSPTGYHFEDVAVVDRKGRATRAGTGVDDVTTDEGEQGDGEGAGGRGREIDFVEKDVVHEFLRINGMIKDTKPQKKQGQHRRKSSGYKAVLDTMGKKVKGVIDDISISAPTVEGMLDKVKGKENKEKEKEKDMAITVSRWVPRRKRIDGRCPVCDRALDDSDDALTPLERYFSEL